MNATLRPLLAGVSLFTCALLLGCGPADNAASVADDNAQTEPDSVASNPSSAPAEQSTTTKPGTPKMPKMAGMKKMNFPAPKDMKFKDDIKSNAEAPKNIRDLTFTNPDGSQTKLSDYEGKKNVVLVFTEGFNGMLCPFCQTQTSRLVSNYEKFKERDCEVIVVYPGPEDHLDEFVEAALRTEKEQVDKVPFPIVLDKDFTATEYFDIKSMLAHPSTYLIDKQGAVKFAYVGNDMTADRPSVKAMLNRLDQLQE